MAYKLNPYLNFDGNCEEAMTFYKDALGVDFIGGKIMRFGDMPGGTQSFPEEVKNKVLHCGLPVGDNVIMASDTFGAPAKFVEGTNNYLALGVDSREEADRLFNILSEGGIVEMPMSQQFFGYFGSFTDKFGVMWMIVYDGETTHGS
ncbi:VOC family protein [Haoranjiania flava]|uniref:VOC family protein n=1 Tax=Haoranjiania flava TaxID=1856322 RepID=A0AAE3INH9_9BACT|nr:VOC family protein [Haoranjiania flava]MCU7694298.1 VOC family protein [Haoranjiania flava]